ncbi:helix-hairpin-helix domain-containing protein [Halobaculum lipolyticum]|uniref:Helix-hairpin-helix domain-containing protein n=1 Tax=Halobaculum lipolyticum TaxID=3032001 RepID=A0ABD5WDJ3_9EURY|nr:helix-hairpin-helix domain-containing protein [Halobaculum sp. DT31]
MKAICGDGLVLECTDFRATETGVVLLGGEEGDQAVGFVPTERIEVVVPDDVAEREHDRLGIPEPAIESAADLEARLDEFAGELGELRSALDSQVEDLVDEGASVDDEETDAERRERLRERRQTIDRQLRAVGQRARQFRQLSADTSEAPTVDDPPRRGGEVSHGAALARPRGPEAAPPATREPAAETSVSRLRDELDDRLGRIEDRIAALAATVEGARVEMATGPSEATDADELDDIDGLGPTYRDRLHDAGVDSLADLVDRGAADVAAVAAAPRSRAEEWVEQARDRLDTPRTAS